MKTLWYVIHQPGTRAVVSLNHIPTTADFPDMTGYTGPYKSARSAIRAAKGKKA